MLSRTYTGTTGGLKVKCFFDGSSWVPLGNNSSPTFDTPNIGSASGTSLTTTGILGTGTALKLDAQTFATLDASPVDGETQFCSDYKVTTASGTIGCSTAHPASCCLHQPGYWSIR